MPEELITRVERCAWAAIEALAEKQAELDDVLATLAESQVRTKERFRETDARIEKLVSAIGEFLSNGKKPL